MGKQGNRRTRNHRKETLFSQPQVGGRPQLQGSQHSVKDTELFLKIAVLVYPFSVPPAPGSSGETNHHRVPEPLVLAPAWVLSPRRRGKKAHRAGTALGR